MGLTRKQWMMLTVIVIGTFVTILNQTLVTPAIPSIMEDTNVDAAEAQWLTTGFTLVNAIMIPITAYLQDRFSVKKLFVFSMSVFCVGTALCAWGPNFLVLLCGRLVQAMGAGILMPMSMTVLLMTFPVERRGSAMGIFGLVIAFAPAIGPTISGIVVDVASWRILFAGVTVLVLIVILLAAILIPKDSKEGLANTSLDPLSVVLSTLGFGGLLYGFSAFGSSGFSIPTVVVAAVGLICVIWFFIRQTKLEVPMLRVRILLNRSFLIATIIGMLVQASLLAGPVLIPIYVQNLLGYPATVSGLIVMPGAIVMGIMNPIAGKIFDKYGPRAMGIVGTILLALTTACFGFVGLNTSIITLTVLFTIRMFAMAIINMPITTWGMNALDNDLMNHGTSINNTLRQVAGSLGTAIVVSVYTLVGTALSGSEPSNDALMTGFNVAFFVCAAMVVVGVVLTIVFVKGKPGTIESLGEEPRVGADAYTSEANKILLTQIMKKDVYALKATDTVKDAMQLFIDRGISACPIIDDKGDAVGFISDGDILKNLAKQSGNYTDALTLIATSVSDDRAYNEKLESIMELPVTAVGTHNLIGVNIHSDIDEVCRVLAEHHLKKVPVIDKGKIAGVINRSDITRYSMEAYLEGRNSEGLALEQCGEEGACVIEPKNE